jgi:branched-chain amino acid transport system ATP-binding protein
MLDCIRITKSFGGTQALAEVDFGLREGELVGLIGPNGSGKSTLVNVVSGFCRPDHGTIAIDGIDVSRRSPQRLRQMGIARTFQNLRLFEAMTVEENVLMGLHPEYVDGRGTLGTWASAIVGTPRTRRADRENRARARDAMRTFALSRYATTAVRDLSYGTKKRVELARALVAAPRLLLLDEPAAGLSNEEVEDLLGALTQYRAEVAPAIVLIEHRLELVLSVSDRMVVLDAGKKLFEGTAAEVSGNEDVIRAYIGG